MCIDGVFSCSEQLHMVMRLITVGSWVASHRAYRTCKPVLTRYDGATCTADNLNMVIAARESELQPRARRRRFWVRPFFPIVEMRITTSTDSEMHQSRVQTGNHRNLSDMGFMISLAVIRKMNIQSRERSLLLHQRKAS